jgi:hypothetical protein
MRSVIQAAFTEVGTEIRGKWRGEHPARANRSGEEERLEQPAYVT